LAIFDEKVEIRERCKGVHCVDLGESFPTSIYLQKSASIQPRTSPSKFGENYSIRVELQKGTESAKGTGEVDGALEGWSERTTISQIKSKTTKAVANRGVGTDAPRGENKNQKEKRREKTSRCIKIVKIREKMECDIQNLVEGKTFTPRKKQMAFSKIKEKAFPNIIKMEKNTFETKLTDTATASCFLET